jgi:L-lactate dehydrogenase complex protein LldE
MNIGLLVTCLVDLWRPEVGFATVKLLEASGCIVHVPLQTCCGQPAYNSGDRKTAQALARQMIDALFRFDAVVAPSGSCAGMVVAHYPDLLADDPVYGPKARALSQRTFELTAFLADRPDAPAITARFDGTIVHHDSCSCLRDLNVEQAPQNLLAQIVGARIARPTQPATCCGFGGTFAVKYPDISSQMAKRKAEDLMATSADLLVSSDLGCLLNIAGTLSRQGSTMKVRHIAEVLAGDLDGPAIGEAKGSAAP